MGRMMPYVMAISAPSLRAPHATAGFGRRFTGFLGLAAAAGFLTHAVLPRMLGTWGATDTEKAMPLPGDDLVPDADEVQTMAVTIPARPEDVWPWLVQMGVDRAGLYSYTWVENGLLHLGVTNADRIHPEWQDLKVGDIIAFTPDGYPGGRHGPRVVALEPGRHLVLDSSPGAPPGTVTGTWQFVLRAAGDSATRLLLRTRYGSRRPTSLRVTDFILRPAYLVMDRAMLLGIRKRAGVQGQATPSSAP
jgi:hypothetical protein